MGMKNNNGSVDTEVTEVLKDTVDDEFATVNDLLNPADIGDSFVTIELNNGKKALVRSLTRAEVYLFKGKKMAAQLFEQKILSIAMVEPKMTRTQIAAWQKVDKAGGNIKKITDKIVTISGMREVTSKSNL
jgi:hypothetical protein